MTIHVRDGEGRPRNLPPSEPPGGPCRIRFFFHALRCGNLRVVGSHEVNGARNAESCAEQYRLTELVQDLQVIRSFHHRPISLSEVGGLDERGHFIEKDRGDLSKGLAFTVARPLQRPECGPPSQDNSPSSSRS